MIRCFKLTRELQTANERLGVLNSEHFGTSKSLKGSGKNYLDGELMDIEHLCCMDHFWAKAKKALNQGCKKAQFFVTEVGKPSAARTCSLATNGTQEPASDDYRVKTALINHYI